MACGVIKQCKAVTKHKCQCKNHVTNNSEFCDRHSKTNNVSINPLVPECSIPENIFVNGKFIPNVNKIKIPKRENMRRQMFSSPLSQY